MSRRHLLFVLGAFVVLILVPAAGAVVAHRDVPARATKTVKRSVTHWSPTTVAISTGNTIKWKAVVGTHSVTAYGGNWRFNHDMLAGQSVHRMLPPGGYVPLSVHVPYNAHERGVLRDVRKGCRQELSRRLLSSPNTAARSEATPRGRSERANVLVFGLL